MTFLAKLQILSGLMAAPYGAFCAVAFPGQPFIWVPLSLFTGLACGLFIGMLMHREMDHADA